MSEPIGLTSDMEDGTMNRYSTMIAVAVVAVLLLALAVDARAGGAGDPMATCVVKSAGPIAHGKGRADDLFHLGHAIRARRGHAGSATREVRNTSVLSSHTHQARPSAVAAGYGVLRDI